MDVHLEKEAFVVGEVANVRVDITNMSNENVESLSVKLKMVIFVLFITSPICHYRNQFYGRDLE